MIFIIGSKNNDNKNKIPVKIDVNPVFPPAVIPAAVSIVATVGLVPKNPQVIADSEQALKEVFKFIFFL
ncbi:hypothetical protein CFSAN002368_19561 [Clostridium botulinum A1 str. CFSAN002368]|nr:hypothetical protein CFSAN002368_19561 [Clostridium botulinum A1 str. CFSAN002368]